MTEQDPQTAEDAARKEAEARRARILNSADDRMDKVTMGNSGSDGKSKSSKLAAMRKRRFKKKAKEETAAETEETQDVKEETSAPEPVETVKPAPEPSQPEGSKDEQEKSAPKKEYMGVAKMRRKMILEKKKKEAEANAAASPAATTTRKKPSSANSLADRMGIMMHIVVVVLLFIAGLDVGLQGHLTSYGEATKIHYNLAPREGKFRFFLPSMPTYLMKNDEEQEQRDLAEKILKDLETEGTYETDKDSQDTEFVESPHLVKEVNIDPLFQADLDEYTKGDGLIMMAARLAVSIHRLLLSIFFYLPLRIWRWGMDVVSSLLVIPPLLGIIAIFIRQVVGTMLLGAELPESGGNESQSSDVISTVANFVKTFLKGSFPTLVSLYGGWVSLRSDMYVVMSGVFVGMALSHSPLLNQSIDGGIKEEL